MLNKTCTLAFVSGSEQQKEKQKSEIREYCKKRLNIPSSEIEFLDSEKLLLEKFKEWKEWKAKGIRDEETTAEDTKGKATVVITDLRVFSSDPSELAGQLYDILVNRRIRVEVIKKEHRDLLEKYQPGKLIVLTKERTLAGLEELCCHIIGDNDK
jgi:hypothetical protein